MQPVRHLTRSVVARLVLALALALSVYAPRTIAFARGDSVDLSAFAFPDGSLPIICLGDTDGGNEGDGLVQGIMTAAALSPGDLPPPPAIGIPSLPVVVGVAAPDDESSRTPADRGLNPPRGPPSLHA